MDKGKLLWGNGGVVRERVSRDVARAGRRTQVVRVTPHEGTIAILRSRVSSKSQSDGEGWHVRPRRWRHAHDVHHSHLWCARSFARDAEPAKALPDEANDLDAVDHEAGRRHLQSHAIRTETVRAVEALSESPIVGSNVPVAAGTTFEGKARQKKVDI